jgi:hypothetical protein
MPEKGAGVGQFFKDALIVKKFVLVGIYRDRCLFTGIIVVDQEAVIPVLFLYGMDVPQMAAAFPALEAFEGQSRLPP